MNETHRELVVSILGATDATWLPARDPRSRQWLNTYASRRAFRSGLGGPWRPSAGGTERVRKRRQRDLDELEAAGLLVLSRRRESRLIGATLTPAGEELARALCGLPGWQESLSAEDELRRLAGSEFAAVEGGWISEIGLTNCGYGDDMDSAELVLVENMLLPALVAGRVESLSDLLGHAWFRLTDAGGLDGPTNPTDVEPCGDLRDLYELELARHLDQFQAKPQTRHEIGKIPMRSAIQTKGNTNELESTT